MRKGERERRIREKEGARNSVRIGREGGKIRSEWGRVWMIDGEDPPLSEFIIGLLLDLSFRFIINTRIYILFCGYHVGLGSSQSTQTFTE